MPGPASKKAVSSVRTSFLAMALKTNLILHPPMGRKRMPRPFCGMGVCRECEALVDDRIVATCLEEWSR